MGKYYTPAQGEMMKTFEVMIKVRFKTSNMDDAERSADLLVDDILTDGQEWDDFTVERAEWDQIGHVTR